MFAEPLKRRNIALWCWQFSGLDFKNFTCQTPTCDNLMFLQDDRPAFLKQKETMTLKFSQNI